jgi:hypothetical protein
MHQEWSHALKRTLRYDEKLTSFVLDFLCSWSILYRYLQLLVANSASRRHHRALERFLGAVHAHGTAHGYAHCYCFHGNGFIYMTSSTFEVYRVYYLKLHGFTFLASWWIAVLTFLLWEKFLKLAA